MKYHKKCLCCGTSYEYCGNCYDYRNYPLWMNSFCSENCKNIFEYCTNYNFQLITKEQAKAALSKCDLSDRANFNACVQRDLNTILAENKSSVEKKDFVKNEPIHEVVTKK